MYSKIEERREYILNEIEERGKVIVKELSRIFLVSDETIRRDIFALEREKKL